MVWFKEGSVESGERATMARELEGVFRFFWEGFDDGVGAVVPGHELGSAFLSCSLIFVSAVLGG